MDLLVQKREKFGKQVKALRREGLIPAELYGHGLLNVHLAVPARDFGKAFKEAGTNTVVTLIIDKEKKPALIYDVAHDALSGEVAHVDFYQVRMDEKIKAKVPLMFVGESAAVKEKGAILNKSMSEVEVEALPQDLPHSFAVSLSLLDDIGKSAYVRDLAVPETVKLLIDGNTAIVTATPPAPKEEEKPVEEVVPDVSEVKVETEEKKAERVTEKVEKPEKAEKAEKEGKTEVKAGKPDTK